MCRLMLLNRQAVEYLESWGALDAMLTQLERSFGGHGNGVAALWSETGRVKVQKGVKLSTEEATRVLSRASARGADWLLFHTRRASSSAIGDQHCHPFQAGQITLAHNGHDPDFARLGRSIGITDTECIAKTWGRLHIPLAALDECIGVFIGFQGGAPFVVKGSRYSDLVAAWHKSSGAVVFASELPSWMVDGVFDQVLEVKRLAWFGRALDPVTLDAVSYQPFVRGRVPRSSYSIWREYPARSSPDHTSMDLTDLTEEEEAFYETLVDEDDDAFDEEGSIVSIWEREAQWAADWQKGRQVEDEQHAWWR